MKRNISTFSLQPSALKCWLPDMDLNHDKQIQSLLCYRYTIGQAGASVRLTAFPGQSRFVKPHNRSTVGSDYLSRESDFTIQRFNDSTIQRN